ncbi:MAG: hypothetical protein MUF14_11225, partial [Hyphomonadaceae bacterium]|nr:hypothetical protein [Hyphomonadaceae bacterium]
MKSQDIVILLKLVSLNGVDKVGMDHGPPKEPSMHSAYSVRSLSSSLKISKTEVASSLNRSIESGLAFRKNNNCLIVPNKRDLLNFLVYGIKFVFPAK